MVFDENVLQNLSVAQLVLLGNITTEQNMIVPSPLSRFRPNFRMDELSCQDTHAFLLIPRHHLNLYRLS
jgi:hypothetical protein